MKVTQTEYNEMVSRGDLYCWKCDATTPTEDTVEYHGQEICPTCYVPGFSDEWTPLKSVETAYNEGEIEIIK